MSLFHTPLIGLYERQRSRRERGPDFWPALLALAALTVAALAVAVLCAKSI